MTKIGYKQTKEHTQHIRENHKGMSGKKHSKESNEKNRQSNIGKTRSVCVKEKMKKGKKRQKERDGYMNSPETREKQKQNALEQFKDGMPEETKEKIRQKRLLQILPTKDTSIELKLQNILKENNIIFEKHKRLLNKYQVDIFIKPNIVIECDGDYWHNRPGCQEKDRFRDKNLNNAGYQVLRFWEHEIHNSLENCKRSIIQCISQ